MLFTSCLSCFLHDVRLDSQLELEFVFICTKQLVTNDSSSLRVDIALNLLRFFSAVSVFFVDASVC